MSQFDIKSRKPVVATKKSVPVEVEAGKDYYWCTCGLSKNQPFCDGSHKVLEGAAPLKWTATESKKVYFCGCKQTGNAPMCDGSHKRIPVEVGEQWDAVKGDIKLSYFDLNGAGELSRVIMAVAGVPFEDERFQVAGDFFSDEMKKLCTGNTDKEWSAVKAEQPYGHMPVLTFKGVKIAESWAIARFLARRFNLMGSNDLEAALIDATCEHLRDFSQRYFKLWGLKTEEEKAEFMKKYVEDLPELLANINKQVSENDGDYLVGKKLSMADLTLWRMIDGCVPEDARAAVPDAVMALFKLVATNENLVKYLEGRPSRPL